MPPARAIFLPPIRHLPYHESHSTIQGGRMGGGGRDLVVKVGVAAASAGIGHALGGGLLGPMIGAFAGNLLAGPAREALVSFGASLTEKACEEFFKSGGESIAERLRDPELKLDGVYRETLRLALIEIKPTDGAFSEWFHNWNQALKDKKDLDPQALQLTEDLTPHRLGTLFWDGMELLAVKGSNSGITTHTLPEPLIALLRAELPNRLRDTFQGLLAKKGQAEALNEFQLKFIESATEKLDGIDATTQRTKAKVDVLDRKADDQSAKLDAVMQMLQQSREQAVEEGRISAQQALQADMARLQQELLRLQGELAARPKDPEANQLAQLLEAGDYEAADRLKTQQIEVSRTKLARDQYELGTIKEARFDWPAALEAYREAWTLERNPEYGFKYAYLAQLQNQHQTAIAVYEELRTLYADPARIAMTLNNLAILYRDVQRLVESESCLTEALAAYRQLAQSNPAAYLPDVAMTLNNLAILYSNVQRLAESESHYTEALSIRRQLAESNPAAYLPDLASTLNNLAVLYSNVQRLAESESHYTEALATYRQLAQSNPAAYLPNVAGTLNNLAVLYRSVQRLAEAESCYTEALSTYRKLAEPNPAAYLPDVAMTLNNLAILYRDVQRLAQSESCHTEALSTYRQLAQSNPAAHLPDLARTLNNLGLLYSAVQRLAESESCYTEALSIRRQLAQSNPAAYLPNVAITLNNLAILCQQTQRFADAEALCAEADRILDPLWQANPALHGNQMARILWMRAALCEQTGGSASDACAFARRALAAAYDPALKGYLQRLVTRYCGPATP